MFRRPFPLGPLLVVSGALLVVVVAGIEMAPQLNAWLSGATPWPQGVMLDALVAGSAGLLAAAVLLVLVIALPNIRRRREEAFQEA